MLEDRLVFILGASGRAAAESAKRAGMQPVVFDRFEDRDLREIATTHTANSFEDLLSQCDTQRVMVCEADDATPRQARRKRRLPLLLTGGTEHHSGLLVQAEKDFDIRPATTSVIRHTRDFQWLAEQFSGEHVFRFPPSLFDGVAPHASEQYHYVWKRFRSAGGLGVYRSRPLDASPNDGYWQRWMFGQPVSLLWYGTARGCHCLAATCPHPSVSDQTARTNPNSNREFSSPFHYTGSTTWLPTQIFESKPQFDACGRLLYERLGDVGLMQADCVLDASGGVWLLDINPRWAASFEVIELAYGINLASMALGTNDFSQTEQSCSWPMVDSHACKEILYASVDYHITESQSDGLFELRKAIGETRMSWIADIPNRNTFVAAQEPLCTLIATGKNPREMSDRMMSLKQVVLRIIAPRAGGVA